MTETDPLRPAPAPTLPTDYPNSATKDLAYTITTGLAAAFNMLVVLVISFVMMPRVEQVNVETRKNRAVGEEVRGMMRENSDALEEHTAAIKRLTEAVDKVTKRVDKPHE